MQAAWSHPHRSEERRVGKECRSRCDWSSDVCSSDLTDDLTGRSIIEIMRSDTENRAWNKALRCRVAALVNRRLAKQISLEEYAVSRQHELENAAECRRRGAILIDRKSVV